MTEGAGGGGDRKVSSQKTQKDRRVHMANERTFLAWVRTSIALMAFGFVVERFALFLKQLTYLLGKEASLPSGGYSSIIGIFLIAMGTATGILSFIRYRKIERQIDEDSYMPAPMLDLLLTIAVSGMGVFLVIYLLRGL